MRQASDEALAYKRPLRYTLGVGAVRQLAGGRLLTDITGTDSVKFGRASLVRGDCLNILNHMSESSISAIVTDPPYGLKEYKPEELEKRDQGRGGIWRIPPSFDGHTRSPLPRFTALNDKERGELYNFFESWSKSVCKVLRPGGHVFFATSAILSQGIYAAIIAGGLEFRGEIIRTVRTLRGGDRPKNFETEFSQACTMPRSCYEPWGLFRKPLPLRMTVGQCLREFGTGALRRCEDDSPFTDLIESERTSQAERKIANHPSLKPQSFLRKIVHASLPLGVGIVLDPFMGSGSTIAAAEACGYESLGIEINPAFFEMAVEAIPRLAKVKVDNHRHKSSLLSFSQNQIS